MTNFIFICLKLIEITFYEFNSFIINFLHIRYILDYVIENLLLNAIIVLKEKERNKV